MLGLFAPGCRTGCGRSPGQPGNDDILAMFSAGEAQAGELGAEVAAGEGDPLGLFEVAAGNGRPSARRPWRRQAAEEAAAGPDILDMFGVPPAKPEGKEAK